MKAFLEKRKWIVILTVVLVLMLILSCAVLLSARIPTAEMSDLSDTVAGGHAAESDTWICASPDMDFGLWSEQFSARAQKKTLVKLPSMAANVLICGEQIYFTYGVPGWVFCTSGGKIPKLMVPAQVDHLTVQDGRMFWIQDSGRSEDGFDTLYMASGFSWWKKQIASHVKEYTVLDGKIVYTAYEPYGMYAYDMETGENTCLYSEDVPILFSDGEVLYYGFYDYTEEEGFCGGKLYRAAPDGSGEQLVSEQICMLAHCYDEYIYYRNGYTGELYRMNTDGSDIRRIAEGNIGSIHIIDNKLLFYRITDGYYLANLDGQNEIALGDR